MLLGTFNRAAGLDLCYFRKIIFANLSIKVEKINFCILNKINFSDRKFVLKSS